MTLIYVFGSSLLLAGLLVVIKAVEIRSQKNNILLGLFRKLEPASGRFVSWAKFSILQIIQSVRYILFVHSRVVCRNILDRIADKIMEEYKVRHNMIMGRREIVGNGSASFYLKKITETKGSGGKIEESL